ncbi:MAG: hypothetical protein Kilf2KO_19660 [Rhodospirillales bacterium]
MRSSPFPLALALVIPLFTYATTTPAAEETIAKTLELEGYELRFIADPEIPYTKSLSVLKDGQEVYEGPFVSRLDALEEAPGGRTSAFPLPPGSDVTGDGQPNLALLSFTGGAHCCFSLQVFALTPTFAQVADIDGEDSPPLLKQVAPGGGYEIELADWTFAYWHAPFVESPAPLVLLRWSEGSYKPAIDLMASPPWSDNALERKVDQVAAEVAAAGKPVPALWREMLTAIYAGNGDQAFALLDRAWPADLPGRDAFLLRFGAQLGLSPYYPALANLNAWPAF